MAFALGLAAFFVSLGMSFTLKSLVTINETDLTQLFFKAFVVVALMEELGKFLFIRGVIFYHADFNEPLDGIVYAVMIGMGFATAENLIYVFFSDGGGGAGIVRMFTAIPAHAFFAILMGYFMGRAKYAINWSKNFIYSFLGLLVAVFFHGIYDYFIFISFVPGIWIISFVALFIAFLISGKAIQLMQRISPFKPADPEHTEDQEHEND